jgi:hypothetical protein
MKDAINSRYMPPWPADPNHGLKFKNDARLSQAEISTFNAWVNEGARNGNDSHAPDLLSKAATESGDWAGPDGRKPDLIVSMSREVQIPAAGDLPYVQIQVPLPLAEDKWVIACQARPGNASVVHHMAITEVTAPDNVSPANLNDFLAMARQMHLPGSVLQPTVTAASNPNVIDMLAIYTPGVATERYCDGCAKLLKGGANNYLAFNIHYTANGKPATDRSQVAFWFRDTPPKHQLLRVAMSDETILANGKELLTDATGERAEGTQMVIPPIAPGQANYALTSVTAFTGPVTLYQFHPHAHFRARDFTYAAVYPDGHEQTLLTIPRYDFHWQLEYNLAAPLSLPAGSKLVVTAHYDNSANNPLNPDPGREVLFRAQNLSTDEMFSPFVQYSEDGKEHPEQTARIVETTGCLTRQKNDWHLTHSSVPAPVASQAASSTDTSHATPGNENLTLIGLSAFNPAQYQGKEVSVRGAEPKGGENRINVTSLLPLARACEQ